MSWMLIKTNNVEWAQDDSGVYTLISATPDNEIRVDVMTVNDEPLMSFIGTEHNVRITLMRWFDSRNKLAGFAKISLEHAAYIGRELMRAAFLKAEYIQD